jgi:hypothetical protein
MEGRDQANGVQGQPYYRPRGISPVTSQQLEAIYHDIDSRTFMIVLMTNDLLLPGR